MASSIKPTQRAFALTIAIIFLVTTIATSALVVWSIIEENKQSDAVTSSLDQSTLDTADAETQENTLQGTMLQNFTPVTEVTALEKIDTQVGTGEEVKPGANVVAHYTGAVAATGIIFQSSLDGGQPIPFSLNGVIQGWTDGVPGMKVGGVRRLVIPAELAYGANPPQGSGIPANAALVFDIELVSLGE